MPPAPQISNDLHFTRSRSNLGSGKYGNPDIYSAAVDGARLPVGYRANDVILRSADSGGTLKSRANSWGGATPLPPSHGKHSCSKRAPLGCKTVVGSRPKNGGAGQSVIPRSLLLPVRAAHCAHPGSRCVGFITQSVSRSSTAVTASATCERYWSGGRWRCVLAAHHSLCFGRPSPSSALSTT
jgi:hypothetical protein